MLLFISFTSCLLAISITKAHKFMVIGCSLTSKLRHFFKQFFRTASEILFTDIKLYCREGPNIQKTSLIEHSFRSKYFNVTAHFRAVSQAKTECGNRHILSRFDTCPARPYPQAEKWPYQACYYFKLHKICEI